MTRLFKASGITLLIGCLLVALCVTIPVAHAAKKGKGIQSVTDGEGNPMPPEAFVGSKKTVGQNDSPRVPFGCTALALDKALYGCADTVQITVGDDTAVDPITVTVVSKDSGATVIDTQFVSCSGSGGVFTGSIVLGSGIAVTDGGSIEVSYDVCSPAVASVACGLAVTNAGYIIQGGCDNDAAGTNNTLGPLFGGGSNEFYNSYMDGNEYTAYTMGFVNGTGKALTDVWVALSFSGAGAPYMTTMNNVVHVGAVAAGATAGAVFQLYTLPTVSGLTAVNLDFDITAPLDGYSLPIRLTQAQLLQTNDIIAREEHCSTFDTNPLGTTWYETAVTGRTTNPWRWTGAAANPGTVGSENRTDGICSSSVANRGMMVGNSATTAANNFVNNADSYLMTNFQPVLQDLAPNGQPYYYQWKWHSFYHASETLSNQGGVWGAFYNDGWDSATNPTADDAYYFPLAVAYYYHMIFDYVGIWNWETANTGTPDCPGCGYTGAPNQLIITFNNVNGLATSSTWFAYGHEHVDVYFFSGSHGTHRDVALDNDNLVYDEWYADADPAACTEGVQLGQVAFDRMTYSDCPASTAVLSVADASAIAPITVVVTSAGTGDSEVVTLTGSAPYFTGNLVMSTEAGIGANSGTLFVLPIDTVSATYADGSPVGSTTATAGISCATGNVTYVSNTLAADNGDNDGFADNNETVTMDITILNSMTTDLQNAKVQIFPRSPYIDCVFDDTAAYGTVAAGASATNPPEDRFSFHVSPDVACADWQSPPKATFWVVISGTDYYGSPTLQSFELSLDLDPAAGGVWTLSQNFTTDPGWATGTVSDDDGNAACAGIAYVNEFHWCAVCGNGNGGYGAWPGNGAFGTGTYALADSSALYSPVEVANGPVTLQFDVAYYTETTYDGAQVQVRLNGGAWGYVPFTTPAQAALTATQAYCSPLRASSSGWTGGPQIYTATNTATVAANLGDTIQFRWRLGTDTSVVRAGGLGVDDVVIGNLSQTQVCEPERNLGFPTCCQVWANGTSCSDGSLCTAGDVCADGVCAGTPSVVCNDDNSCTDDTCVPLTGGCAYVANDANSCTDNDSCSTDHCSSGVCVGTENGTCGVAGTVYYYRTGFTTGSEPSTKVVPNVGVDGTQDGLADDTTDASGAYAVDLFGNVVVAPTVKFGTPRASDHNGAISSLDASTIARGAVALITLSPNQQVAGDVTGNGALSAMDASDVSRFAVGLIDHFTVATTTGSDWKFLRCDAYGYPGANGCQPASYSFNPLVGQETGKNFFAILYGEVTGNWAAAALLSSEQNNESSVAEKNAAASDAALGARIRARGKEIDVVRNPNAGPADLTVSGWMKQLRAGETREVTINLKNADGIRALDLLVTYDPSRIAIVGARSTGIADGYSVVEGDAQGTHRIAAYGILPMSGSGSTLILTVKAKKNAGAELPIEISGSANEGGIPVRVLERGTSPRH